MAAQLTDNIVNHSSADFQCLNFAGVGFLL